MRAVSGADRIRDASSAKRKGQALGGARAQLPNWHDVPTPTNKRTGRGFRPSQRAKVVRRFQMETGRPQKTSATWPVLVLRTSSSAALTFTKNKTYITPSAASALRCVSEPEGVSLSDVLTFSARDVTPTNLLQNRKGTSVFFAFPPPRARRRDRLS